jgi:hypothetical protein
MGGRANANHAWPKRVDHLRGAERQRQSETLTRSMMGHDASRATSLADPVVISGPRWALGQGNTTDMCVCQTLYSLHPPSSIAHRGLPQVQAGVPREALEGDRPRESELATTGGAMPLLLLRLPPYQHTRHSMHPLSAPHTLLRQTRASSLPNILRSTRRNFKSVRPDFTMSEGVGVSGTPITSSPPMARGRRATLEHAVGEVGEGEWSTASFTMSPQLRSILVCMMLERFAMATSGWW